MKPQELKALNVQELLESAKTADALEPISKVIGRIRENNSYGVFVEEKERTAIVTLRDVLNVKNITSTKVSSIMHYLPRINRSTSVGEAARIMFEYRVRSLPVYENSKLEGQISSGAVIGRLMESPLSEKVSSVMTANPICMQVSDDAAKARQIMLKERIDQLPIQKDSKLAGVITSSAMAYNMIPEVDRNVAGDKRGPRFDISVLEYAEDTFTSNDIKDTLNEIFKNMQRSNTQYSVITNFDEIQGIVTYRDLLRLVVEQRATANNVPMYMIGLPEDPFEAEATKEKFSRVVTLLHKEYPDMEEARAIIKAGKTKASKNRYEVTVFVKTPRRQFSYQGTGYELPEVFDGISGWSKKQAARTQKKPKRRTRADPGNPEGMV